MKRRERKNNGEEEDISSHMNNQLYLQFTAVSGNIKQPLWWCSVVAGYCLDYLQGTFQQQQQQTDPQSNSLSSIPGRSIPSTLFPPISPPTASQTIALSFQDFPTSPPLSTPPFTPPPSPPPAPASPLLFLFCVACSYNSQATTSSAQFTQSECLVSVRIRRLYILLPLLLLPLP